MAAGPGAIGRHILSARRHQPHLKIADRFTRLPGLAQYGPQMEREKQSSSSLTFGIDVLRSGASAPSAFHPIACLRLNV